MVKNIDQDDHVDEKTSDLPTDTGLYVLGTTEYDPENEDASEDK